MSPAEDRAEWTRRHTRVAAYALCLDDDQRVLLCRIAPGYPGAGQWTLPGGGIEFGEAPADAALRELTEETGLAGTIESLAFVHSFAREAQPERGLGPWHGIRIVYRVAVMGGDLRDEMEESTDMAAWFSFDEADALPLVDLALAAITFLTDRTPRSGD